VVLKVRGTKRTRLSAVLAIAVTLSMTLPAMPVVAVDSPVTSGRPVALPRVGTAPQRDATSGMRTLALDDEIPGVPLPASPFSFMLTIGTDVDDVFSVALAEGETLSVSITGSSGSYIDP